jgi:hypothetical protein
MASDARLSRLLRRATYGDPYLRELRTLGERRRTALADAESALRQVERLLPRALDAGLTITEIADLSAVSRPTLYKLIAPATHPK